MKPLEAVKQGSDYENAIERTDLLFGHWKLAENGFGFLFLLKEKLDRTFLASLFCHTYVAVRTHVPSCERPLATITLAVVFTIAANINTI